MMEKYRAWDTKNKRMISAEELANEEDCHVILLNPLTGKFWHVELQCSFDPNEDDDLLPLKYTGTTDKRGNEIYEGDIIRFSVESKMGLKYCYNDHIKWMQIKDDEYDDFESGFHFSEDPILGELIGNIYQNPEILEEK